MTDRNDADDEAVYFSAAVPADEPPEYPPDWLDALPVSGGGQSCAFCGSQSVSWVHRLEAGPVRFEMYGEQYTLPGFWTLCGACEEVYTSGDDDAAVERMMDLRRDSDSDGAYEARAELSAFRGADIERRRLPG